MNCRSLLCLFTACFIFSIKAQTFKITKSEEFVTPKTVWNNEIFGHDKEAYYHLRNNGNWAGKYVIQKTNIADGKIVFEIKIDLSNEPAYKGRDGYLISNVLKNNKILLFIRVTKNSEMKLLMQEYSAMDGQNIGEPVVIEKVEDKLFSLNNINITVEFSPDRDKMLVISEIKRDKREQDVVLKLYAGDHYQRVWEKEVIKTFRNSTASSFNYKIDNAGNVVYIFSYHVPNKEEDVDYGVGLIPVSKDTELFAIGSQEQIKKLRVDYCGNNFIFTGDCRKNMKAHDYPLGYKRGFYFATLNLDELSITENFTFPPKDVEVKFNYTFSQNEPGSSSKTFDYVETVFVGRCYYVLRSHQQSKRKCFEKEIIITKYNQNNNFEWMKVIPRNSCNEVVGLNYVVADKLYLIYYENPKNLVEYPDPSQYNCRKYHVVAKLKLAALVCTGIDKDGKLTRKQIDTGADQVLLKEYNAHDSYLEDSKTIITETILSPKLRRYNLLTFSE